MTQLSDRQLAKEFGISPQMLARRFKDAGIKTGRGVKHTILQAHEAIATKGNLRTETDKAKLRNLEEDAQQKEMKRKLMERELVTMSEAIDLLIKPFSTLSKMIKDMPSRLAVQCNPSDHDLSREVLDDYARELCNEIQNACTKLSSKS